MKQPRSWLQVGSMLGGLEQPERVRVDCQWDRRPFPAFFTPFFSFTQAEFMRPLRVCMQCQQWPANIFIQQREERGDLSDNTHTPPRRQTAPPAHSSAEHTRKHFGHLTCLSFLNTLAGFFEAASDLLKEFSPRFLLLWINLYVEGRNQNVLWCPEDWNQRSAPCNTPTYSYTFRHMFMNAGCLLITSLCL